MVEQRNGPSGHEVSITGFASGGSGCPAGCVGSILSSDLTALTLIYDSFIAQSGPDIKPKDHRKNCQINVRLHFPHGWQFSIFKADYLKTDVFGVQSTVWSPCGEEGMLNINSAIQLSPLDSIKPALLTVRRLTFHVGDATDGEG